jgi:hypothetical protein
VPHFCRFYNGYLTIKCNFLSPTKCAILERSAGLQTSAMLQKCLRKPCFNIHFPSQGIRWTEAPQQKTLRHTVRGKPPMLWEKTL